MNEDIYSKLLLTKDPWTESTHFFSFYQEPDIVSVFPIQGRTNETTEIIVTASIDKPFATRKNLF